MNSIVFNIYYFLYFFSGDGEIYFFFLGGDFLRFTYFSDCSEGLIEGV
jgi:hypothetical protein